MSEPVIRLMTPEDRKLMSEFYDAMGPETRFFVNRREGNRKFNNRYLDGNEPNALFYLAEEEGKMVGLVFLWDMDTGIPWLGIAVRDDYKGKHLGRKLILHAQHIAVEQGKGGIILTTAPANIRGQALYENMGFVLHGNCYKAEGELLYIWRVKSTK